MLHDARTPAVRTPRCSIGSANERQFWADLVVVAVAFARGGEPTFAALRMNGCDAKEAAFRMSLARYCAAMTQVTPAGLETMRKEKRGPRYTRPSHKIVRYRRADLDAYMEAHLIDPAERG